MHAAQVAASNGRVDVRGQLDAMLQSTGTALTQTTTSAELDEPAVRRMRIELLLVETESGWQVNVVQVT